MEHITNRQKEFRRRVSEIEDRVALAGSALTAYRATAEDKKASRGPTATGVETLHGPGEVGAEPSGPPGSGADGSSRGSIEGARRRLETQSLETESLRAAIGRAEAAIAGLSEKSPGLTGELRTHLHGEVGQMVAGVERQFRRMVDDECRRTVESFVRNFEQDAAERISRIEDGVSQQTSITVELAEASLQTHANVDRLLGAFDRLAAARPAEPEPLRSGDGPVLVKPRNDAETRGAQDFGSPDWDTALTQSGAAFDPDRDDWTGEEPEAESAAGESDSRLWKFLGKSPLSLLSSDSSSRKPS